MEDTYAELTVGVDVWMKERSRELECWWCVGIVIWEYHRGFKITAVIEGGGVENHQGNGPVLDGIIGELRKETGSEYGDREEVG